MRKQLQPRRAREEERSSKATASMFANASIVVRYLHSQKKREREREAKESLPLSRATICIVITIMILIGDSSLRVGKIFFNDPQSIRWVKICTYAYASKYVQMFLMQNISIDRHMAYCSVINGNKLLSDSLAVYGSEEIKRRCGVSGFVELQCCTIYHKYLFVWIIF